MQRQLVPCKQDMETTPGDELEIEVDESEIEVPRIGPKVAPAPWNMYFMLPFMAQGFLIDDDVQQELSRKFGKLTKWDAVILHKVRIHFTEKLKEFEAELAQPKYHTRDESVRGVAATPSSRSFWNKMDIVFEVHRQAESGDIDPDLEYDPLAINRPLIRRTITSDHFGFLHRVFTTLSHEKTVVCARIRTSYLYCLQEEAALAGVGGHPLWVICQALAQHSSLEAISRYALQVMRDVSAEICGEAHIVTQDLDESKRELDLISTQTYAVTHASSESA